MTPTFFMGGWWRPYLDISAGEISLKVGEIFSCGCLTYELPQLSCWYLWIQGRPNSLCTSGWERSLVDIPSVKISLKVEKFSLADVLHTDVRSYNAGSRELKGVLMAPTFLIGMWEHLHVDVPTGVNFDQGRWFLLKTSAVATVGVMNLGESVSPPYF